MEWVIYTEKNGEIYYAKNLDDSTDDIDLAMHFNSKEDAETWVGYLKEEWGDIGFKIKEIK